MSCNVTFFLVQAEIIDGVNDVIINTAKFSCQTTGEPVPTIN